MKTEKDENYNYIDQTGQGNYFVFNRYKTSKKYGQQKIEIPIELWEILREWIKVSKSEWLFHCSMSNLSALRSDQFTRFISSIFEKPGVGVNILRHAFVSDTVLSQMPFLDELKETAYKLGHSPSETILYKKHN
jgi:integrase